MTKSLALIAILLVIGCNTSDKRGERAYASASKLHAGYISVIEQSLKLAGDQTISSSDRQKLEDVIKEVRINRKGDELVQVSLSHCEMVEALANSWINGFKGNLESRILVDMQALTPMKQGPFAKAMAPAARVLEARIASEQGQLDQANRVVAPVVAFLPEIQKTRSEILTLGSKQ